MEYLGKTKIGRFSAKPNVIYPQLRLPQDCQNVIGETAYAYATEHEGKKAFIFVLQDREEREDKSASSANRVLQLNDKVLQLSAESSIEARLSEVESQISELKSLLLLNEGDSLHKNEKNDGLGRIRTGDLRHVKAMS